MRTLPVLAALLLASCGRDRCEVELRSVVPLVGSDDVPLGTSIVFELDRARGDETVTLTLDGDPVPGVTTVDGDRVIFAPDEPLAPDTRYEAELSGGCGHFTAFTTVDAAAGAVDDPDALVGSTYLVDLDGAEVEPPLVALMLSEVDEDIALGITSVTDEALHTRLTLVLEPGVQDPCTPTHELPAADWDNPEFDLHTLLPLPLPSGGVALNELRISGRFAQDGSTIDRTLIRTRLDLRATEDPVAACFALALAGTPCVPCADGTALCVDVEIDAGRSERVDGWTLLPRSAEQIAADPGCG